MRTLLVLIVSALIAVVLLSADIPSALGASHNGNCANGCNLGVCGPSYQPPSGACSGCGRSSECKTSMFHSR